MNTPVDIDKLKELQSLLSDGEWWQTVTRGPNPTSFTSDMTHVARQAAALIAKAERVDALTEALSEAATTFDQFTAALREHDAAGLAQEIAVAELAAQEARNTLSPKESE